MPSSLEKPGQWNTGTILVSGGGNQHIGRCCFFPDHARVEQLLDVSVVESDVRRSVFRECDFRVEFDHRGTPASRPASSRHKGAGCRGLAAMRRVGRRGGIKAPGQLAVAYRIRNISFNWCVLARGGSIWKAAPIATISDTTN